MAPIVSLRKIAHEVEALGHGWTAYLNRQTGEVYSVPSDEANLLEVDTDLEALPDWQREEVATIREILEGDNWLPLPGQFDVHEWALMRDFSYSVANAHMRDQLLRAIHGTGAFRYFKATVDQLGLREQWYRFKNQAIQRIVADFLDLHGIDYSRDDPSASAE